jgi:hypothetical protein
MLFALLLAEVALRLAGVVSTRRGAAWYAGGNHPRYLFEPDPAAGYRLRPGFAGTEIARSGEFQTAVRIDSRGLRADGQRRLDGGVVALGDSMTFGEGVAAEQAYPAQLAARLGVPVANAGVPGYSSRQMAARLETLLPALRPRLVLLTIAALWDLQRCANPFVYAEGYIVSARYRDRLHLVGDDLLLEQVRGPVMGPLSISLMRHSHLLRLGLPALRSALLARSEAPPTVPPDADWQSCRVALQGAAAAARSAGAGFAVVLAESPDAVSLEATARVASALESAGVRVWRLDALLGGADPAWRYPRDRHWNPAGHQRVAATLEAPVRALLSEPPAAAGTPPPGGEAGR